MKALFSKARFFMILTVCFMSKAAFALVHSDIFGCDPCHTPHDAKVLPGVPLWGGNETTTTFTMYSSATFKGAIDGQPSGNSKLCLSCHDGANPDFTWLAPELTFGSEELANSHPISFVYDSALAALDSGLKDPSQPSTLGGTIAEDLLDPESKMQCGSCHDVHTSGVGQHLLRGYDYGSQHGPELCRMCHLK
jgi:predicted CXXCH cytochrome family protein